MIDERNERLIKEEEIYKVTILFQVKKDMDEKVLDDALEDAFFSVGGTKYLDIGTYDSRF